MDPRLAILETRMEEHKVNFERQVTDHRSLRQTFTNVTIALVGLIMGAFAVVATGYYWTADNQTALMKEQIETNANMRQMTKELQKIGTSIESINKDHVNFKR